MKVFWTSKLWQKRPTQLDLRRVACFQGPRLVQPGTVGPAPPPPLGFGWPAGVQGSAGRWRRPPCRPGRLRSPPALPPPTPSHRRAPNSFPAQLRSACAGCRPTLSLQWTKARLGKGWTPNRSGGMGFLETPCTWGLWGPADIDRKGVGHRPPLFRRPLRR